MSRKWMSSFKVRSKHFSYSFVITETSLSSSSKMAGDKKQSHMKTGNGQHFWKFSIPANLWAKLVMQSQWKSEPSSSSANQWYELSRASSSSTYGRFSKVRVPRVTLNVGGVAADENYTMCGPSFHVCIFPNIYYYHRMTHWLKSNIHLTLAQLLHDVA